MKNRILFALFVCMAIITACNQGDNNSTGDASAIAGPGDPVKGKQYFALCIACHADNAQGLQKMNAPTLAGQDAWYLTRQLNNYRTGIRGTDSADTHGKLMNSIANILVSEQAVNDVVAYINTLPASSKAQTITGDIEKGKGYYNMTCSSCHGINATGNKTLFAPKLLGIDDWYMERQLYNFRNNIRGRFPHDKIGAQMSYVIGTIKDEQALKDIIAYLHSLEQTQAAAGSN